MTRVIRRWRLWVGVGAGYAGDPAAAGLPCREHPIAAEAAPTRAGKAPTRAGQAPTRAGQAPTRAGQAPTRTGPVAATASEALASVEAVCGSRLCRRSRGSGATLSLAPYRR